MQLADSPELCSLNHFNSGQFMKVLGKAQVSGILCVDQHPSVGAELMSCWDFQGTQGWKHLHELHEGGEAADRAVPGLKMYGMTQVHPASCPGKAPACTMPGWDVAVTAQALGQDSPPASGWQKHSRLWMLGNTKPQG